MPDTSQGGSAPMFAVLHSWADGENASLAALFTGAAARQRAEDWAEGEAHSLTGQGFNVFRFTGADDYEGDLDCADWDVDVLVEEIAAADINPDRPVGEG
jgi:hypothetical protein